MKDHIKIIQFEYYIIGHNVIIYIVIYYKGLKIINQVVLLII